MQFTLQEFNKGVNQTISKSLFQCCGSRAWTNQMMESRPFQSITQMEHEASKIWFGLSPADWLLAFEQHPQIGDISSIKEKFPNTASMAASEQSGTAAAADTLLKSLAEYNQVYLEKFGFIFIICASGKSAEEMLYTLKKRLAHSPREEILIAAREQDKITRLRLKKLIK